MTRLVALLVLVGCDLFDADATASDTTPGNPCGPGLYCGGCLTSGLLPDGSDSGSAGDSAIWVEDVCQPCGGAC
jgi:hypothetical protein